MVQGSYPDKEVVLGIAVLPASGSTYMENSRTFSLAASLVKEFGTNFKTEIALLPEAPISALQKLCNQIDIAG